MLPIRDDDDDYEAMLIGNNILGGGSLSNRLADRVRQHDGLSYTVGSQFSADSIDRRGTFITYAIMNPENREKLLNAVGDEFQRILDSGVSWKNWNMPRPVFWNRCEPAVAKTLDWSGCYKDN